MTALAERPVEPVVLDQVRRGLTEPHDGSRELDAVLDAARAAERDGVTAVVVPPAGASAPAAQHWPSTAQALAVLLATTRIRVVVGVHTGAWRADALARFAAGATRLAGDRLTVEVHGPGAERFAERVRVSWGGEVHAA